MSETAGLVERLRYPDYWVRKSEFEAPRKDDAPKLAADLIEALTAERDKLETSLYDCNQVRRELQAIMDKDRAEADALRQAHKRFREVLNDIHDVPPEHESEPVPFHKGWELAVRRLHSALSPKDVK